MIQAFVDESGIDASGPFLVLVGVIGKAEEWLALSDEWQAVLERPPKIEVFKMKEAANSRRMASKLRELAPVMNAHPFTIIYTATDLAGFDEVMAGLKKPLSDPYFFPFHSMIWSTCFELLDQQQAERFEIIFDEQMIFGPRAKSWYPMVKELIDHEIREIMPVEPMFKTDDEFIPLQVADIFAWLLRREFSGLNHDFGWLPDALPAIQWSAHSQMYSRERLRFQIGQSYDPEFLAKALGIWDEYLAGGGEPPPIWGRSR